jgi:putative hydrolase of the HAD superfamily
MEHPRRDPQRIEAVVFDYGGVIISPIVDKVQVLADRFGVTMHQLLEVLLGPRESGEHPWHRCERGEIAVAEIQGLLGPWARNAGLSLHGDEIDVLMEPTYSVLHQVVERIALLKAAGYRTALLTNTFAEYRPTMQQVVPFGHFHAVVESFEVRSRKPERAIYEATARMLDVDHDRILYLDDFDQNLRPAIELGWSVVHVTGPDQCLTELDRLVPFT